MAPDMFAAELFQTDSMDDSPNIFEQQGLLPMEQSPSPEFMRKDSVTTDMLNGMDGMMEENEDETAGGSAKKKERSTKQRDPEKLKDTKHSSKNEGQHTDRRYLCYICYKLFTRRRSVHREVRQSITSTLTPLNIALVIALITLVYYRLFKPYNSTAATLSSSAPGSDAIVFQTFTPRTLLRFNGLPTQPLNPEGKVYIAVKGKVHDVTGGRNFYGPGGPYENFAGRDATRGLACQSFDEDMLTKDLDGPLDDCADLGPEQLENLQGWVERFDQKVSRIHACLGAEVIR